MYSPFLWRNAKGQSKSIIKRRWRWRTPKPCQICSQATNLIKNVHQNLSLNRLNGQDMIQRTSNVWIIRSSRWRNVMLGLVPLNPIVWCYVCYYVWHYVWLNVVINKVSLLLLSKVMVTWIFGHYHIVHEIHSMWFMWFSHRRYRSQVLCKLIILVRSRWWNWAFHLRRL